MLSWYLYEDAANFTLFKSFLPLLVVFTVSTTTAVKADGKFCNSWDSIKSNIV